MLYIFNIFYYFSTFEPRISEFRKRKNLCPLGVKSRSRLSPWKHTQATGFIENIIVISILEFSNQNVFHRVQCIDFLSKSYLVYIELRKQDLNRFQNQLGWLVILSKFQNLRRIEKKSSGTKQIFGIFSIHNFEIIWNVNSCWIAIPFWKSELVVSNFKNLSGSISEIYPRSRSRLWIGKWSWSWS